MGTEENIMETTSVNLFDLALGTCPFPIEECGIHFNGKIDLEDGLSILTDKLVKQDNPEQAKTNYLKVMEVQELTEIEKSEVTKARNFLKLVFKTIFREKAFYVALYSVYFGFVVNYVAKGQYLWALIYLAIMTWALGLSKGIKEFIKTISYKKRLEELKEELGDNNLFINALCVDSKEDISLYIKTKNV